MSGSHPILGQQRALTALGRALAGGHVHHAWIFHGPPGVGKRLAAEEFARILLDPAATAADRASCRAPRGTAVSRLIDAGTHPDLHVIRKELASVSENRELRDRKQLNIPVDLLRERMIGGLTGDGRHHESAVFRTATLGHGKVFVVDEAELLETEAQNAMLKTLEEPPPGTVIVLVTAHEDRLLPTVRSRCQRIAFGPLDDASMRSWWESGGPEVPAGDREFVAEFAEGAPGMAVLAARHGLAAWQAELSPHLDAIESGGFPPGIGERMAELAEAFAASIVDEDEQSSKEAANRQAVRLMARLLGLRVRRALRRSADDPAALARWIGAGEAIAEFERNVRSNVNVKHAFANLVAQWAERTAPTGPAAGAGRGR